MPDLPGFGRSGSRKDMLDIPDLARAARDFLDDRDVEKATLVRWIGRSRDRGAVDPAAAESDIGAELKRLRRENEILRQERDILKKATAFFVREGSR
mgnify:CR=1 FL=1